MLRKNRKKIKSAPRLNKNIIVIILLIFSLAVIWLVFLYFQGDKLRINNQTYDIEIVDEPKTRQKGLSDYQELKHNEGMLFVFDKPGEYCFWMKDMDFAIDIIWLDDSRQVVDYKENITPDSYPESFCPDSLSKYVLEVNSGDIQKLEINLGDKASF